MAVQTTINFQWQFKKRKRSGRKSTDVSVNRGKKTMTILFRNGTEKFFMPEGYMIFGISNNLLGFMKSDSTRGYRVEKPYATTGTKAFKVVIKDPDNITRLAPFVGNYDLEFNEVNQLFIDRRHVK